MMYASAFEGGEWTGDDLRISPIPSYLCEMLATSRVIGGDTAVTTESAPYFIS